MPLDLLHLVDFTGVAVFAVSGALAAGRKSLDLLGVVVIAIVTSIGGGTLRDLLLDRHPVFWIADARYLVVIVAAALLTVLWARRREPPHGLLLYADALGLAFFSVSGAQIAQGLHLPGLIVVVMGTITGVFGGVLRDVLCAEIPLILRRGQIYATTAIAGTSGYLLLARTGVPEIAAAATGMSVIVGLRVAAIRWDLALPVFSLPEQDGRRD